MRELDSNAQFSNTNLRRQIVGGEGCVASVMRGALNYTCIGGRYTHIVGFRPSEHRPQLQNRQPAQTHFPQVPPPLAWHSILWGKRPLASMLLIQAWNTG